MATVARVAGDKEGNDKGCKGNGDCNKEGNGNGNNTGDCYHDKGGGRATVAATMAMATATTWAMAIVARWWATKSVMARAARVTAMALRVVGEQQQQIWQWGWGGYKGHGHLRYNQKQCHDKCLGFCCLVEERLQRGCRCCYLCIFLLLAGLSLFWAGQKSSRRRGHGCVCCCCCQIHHW